MLNKIILDLSCCSVFEVFVTTHTLWLYATRVTVTTELIFLYFFWEFEEFIQSKM